MIPSNCNLHSYISIKILWDIIMTKLLEKLADNNQILPLNPGYPEPDRFC